MVAHDLRRCNSSSLCKVSVSWVTRDHASTPLSSLACSGSFCSARDRMLVSHQPQESTPPCSAMFMPLDTRENARSLGSRNTLLRNTQHKAQQAIFLFGHAHDLTCYEAGDFRPVLRALPCKPYVYWHARL